MNPTLRSDGSLGVKRTEYAIKSFRGFDALSPERALPLSVCTYGYNVTVGDGRVVGGVGISDAKIDGNLLPNAITVGSRMVKAAVFVKDDRKILVALMQNRRLYYADFSDEAFTYAGVEFGDRRVTFLPYHYDNKDCLLIVGADGQMLVYDGETFESVPDAPRLNTACVYNERVYGIVTDGVNRLYFSDDLDPTNWHVSLTEGGYVDFVDAGGKVTGVIPFGGSLYVFREYAVHRLSAYIDQSDYVMTKVYSGHDRIYFDTAQVVFDQLIFLTDSGFLSVHSGGIKRLFEGVNPLIEGRENAISGSYGYKYMLSFGMVKDNYVVGDENYGDPKNNAVFIYDFATGKETILRGADVGQFLPVALEDGYKLLVLFGSIYRGFHVGEIDQSGRIFGTPIKKLWRSPYTDLNVADSDKVIRKAYVTVTKPIYLKVKGDRQITFGLGGTPYSQIVPVRRKGHKIGLEVSTEQDSFVLTDVTLEVDFVRRSVGALIK